MQEQHFPLPSTQKEEFFLKALQWAYQTEPYLACFNNCSIAYPFGAFPQLLAAGAKNIVPLAESPFEALQAQLVKQPDWYCGYFSYELKNGIHGLRSKNPDSMEFAQSCFFAPKHLLMMNDAGIVIRSEQEPQQIFEAVLNTKLLPLHPCQAAVVKWGMTKDEYLQKVRIVKEHIREGDCYELNLCMEFLSENYQEDPLLLYRQLIATSPTPFSTFQRFQDHYLISASPERFLKKEGDQLISQPIKGTIRRGKSPGEDEQLRQQLASSEKDRAENMMIVDLVRNDLAQSSSWGSVAVPELFGIYSFRQLHQMISTITSRLRPGISAPEAIKRAFPMGSMTGAPKRMVMELIDRYENSQRGLYSGAAGFFTPEGDFDFNVVIRSMLYNQAAKRLSFSVGGAITWDSDPEQEYEECLLKAKAILEVLGARISQE